MTERGWSKSGIYIHIPFCKNLCPYCDFYSKTATTNDFADFIPALKTEAILRMSTDFGDLEYDTVYFGGGTPSILKPDRIAELIEHLGSHFRIAADAEITLECNPDSIHSARAREYSHIGVNRISLGVQSFNDYSLRMLGRIHDSKKSHGFVPTAPSSGIREYQHRSYLRTARADN